MMALYAKCNATAVLDIRDSAQIDPQQLGAQASQFMKPGIRWLPVTDVLNNTATNYPAAPVVTFSTITAGSTGVTRTTTIADLTGAALSAAKDAQQSQADRYIELTLLRFANALFNLAKVDTPSLTLTQFRNAVNAQTDIDQAALRAWIKGLL